MYFPLIPPKLPCFSLTLIQETTMMHGLNNSLGGLVKPFINYLAQTPPFKSMVEEVRKQDLKPFKHFQKSSSSGWKMIDFIS